MKSKEGSFRPRLDWLELGEGFHDVVEAARFPEHRLRYWNGSALEEVGLHTVDPVEHFGRFTREVGPRRGVGEGTGASPCRVAFGRCSPPSCWKRAALAPAASSP